MVGEEMSRSRKGDFELRHWRSSSSSSSSERKKQPSLRRRATAVLPAIEIPNGGGGGSELESGSFGSERGYTSLRDILSSPRYSSASAADSPIGAGAGGGGGGGGGGGSCAEIRISNPLVKQAAYAYLQPTPSMREPSRRRRSRLCRLLLALACCCSGGAGRGGAAALFGPCFDFLGRLFGR